MASPPTEDGLSRLLDGAQPYADAWAAERAALADLAWMRAAKDQTLDELTEIDPGMDRAAVLMRRLIVLDEWLAERSARWAEAHKQRLDMAEAARGPAQVGPIPA
jgi:hypothetical protein